MSRLSNNIGNRILRKRLKTVTRDKGVQNFDTAERAIILFDTSLKNVFTVVKNFSKFLSEHDIKTSVFGYMPQKEAPEEMILWNKFEYITRKDISWFGSPKGEIAAEYFKKVPDLLFIINSRENLTIEFLTQLSRAKFKVGCFTEQQNDLDLMINTGKQEFDAEYFIEQVKHYISILNPSN